MSYRRFNISADPWLMAKTANPAKVRRGNGSSLAPLAEIAISQRDEPENEGGGAGREKPLSEYPSKPTKAPFEGFEGDPGTRVLRNYELDERAAMAAEGRVPEVYIIDFAKMQMHPPSTMSVDRWRTAINDAGLALDEWGDTAASLGWTPAELFAAGGLVWQIDGQGVVSLDHDGAVLTNGRRIPRRAARRRA